MMLYLYPSGLHIQGDPSCHDHGHHHFINLCTSNLGTYKATPLLCSLLQLILLFVSSWDFGPSTSMLFVWTYHVPFLAELLVLYA